MARPADSTEMAKQKLLNLVQFKRKTNNNTVEHERINNPSCAPPPPANDAVLTRLAIEEIQKEVNKGSVRATLAGPSGWRPIPRMTKENKRLLNNTMRSVVAHNRRQADPSCGVRQKSEHELDAIIAGGQQRKPKFDERKHCFRKVTKKNKE